MGWELDYTFKHSPQIGAYKLNISNSVNMALKEIMTRVLVKSGDESTNHLVMNLMIVDLDVLNEFRKSGVFGDENGHLVVTTHKILKKEEIYQVLQGMS